jgi:hypothetical protein
MSEEGTWGRIKSEGDEVHQVSVIV